MRKPPKPAFCGTLAATAAPPPPAAAARRFANPAKERSFGPAGVKRMRSMKKLLVLTALVGGFALTQQAGACEWMKQAAKPATVVTCEDGTCTAEQAQQEAATTETAPTSAQTVQEPAPASPTLVAQGQ
jgi:hypothetical protein